MPEFYRFSTYGASFSRTASGTGTGLNSPRRTQTRMYCPLATTISGSSRARHFELQLDRARPDAAEVGIDHQQLIERDRMKEIALHVHARQPEPHLVHQRLVRQPAGAEQLHLGQPEEAEIGLVVDDPRRVDVFPADVLGYGEAHGRQCSWSSSRRRSSQTHLSASHC